MCRDINQDFLVSVLFHLAIIIYNYVVSHTYKIALGTKPMGTEHTPFIKSQCHLDISISKKKQQGNMSANQS